MRNIIQLLGLSLILLFGSFSPLKRSEYKVKTVVIDAGHGGKDSGTVGAFSKEKDIALKISLEVGSIINKYIKDVKVIYTRSDDTFIPLEERAQIANRNGADAFISIHCNSLPASTTLATKTRIYGTETFVMGLHTSEANLEVAKRENSVIMLEENYEERYEGFDPKSPESHILFSLYQNAYLENSLMLANNIETQFKDRVGRHSRGVKQAGFWVLYRTSMPSVLVEVGFLSNANEEKYLNDPVGQSYIASGIFRAFRDYKNNIESIN
ncbi:MAG: N-acetylmuramoyl-L-alanine amidase [Cyclobacteriaceae bacterium]